MWGALKNYADAALLFLRITLGGFFIYVHGFPKLAGGLVKWKAVGANMKYVGVSFAPGMWGFMAASAETIGCLLLMVGFCFRPSCLMLVLTMIVAAVTDYSRAKGGVYPSLLEASHAIEMGLVFFTLMFVGPGRFSVDKG
jgi:putative oxidoreductase